MIIGKLTPDWLFMKGFLGDSPGGNICLAAKKVCWVCYGIT